MKTLVTGSAGFIGFHLANALAGRGESVVGLDNLNGYYDVSLKQARLKASGFNPEAVSDGQFIASSAFPDYRFVRLDLTDRAGLFELFERERPDRVCHLAAQAGVRYSLTNPEAYIESNVTGFLNVLEACRHYHVDRLIYASSSSVYGLNEEQPQSVHHRTDRPANLYAVTKKTNELMAHAYAHLYGIRTTGLRFFTVYGPWGRPDMAPMLFTRAILAGEPIEVFGGGEMYRDFTYVDDIVRGIVLLLDREPSPGAEVFNIGRGEPVRLLDFIETLESCLGRKAIIHYRPFQPGEVASTHADCRPLWERTGYRPDTSLRTGIEAFAEWYKKVYS
jgi:UDP-glucuronate 4-epimerase